MKLYCIKFLNEKGKIEDVDHLLEASSEKFVHEHMNSLENSLKHNGLMKQSEHINYSFFEVKVSKDVAIWDENKFDDGSVLG